MENEILEGVKSVANQLQKDVERSLDQVKEQVKMDGKVSADAIKQVEELSKRVTEFEKEQKASLSELSTKMNRDTLPGGGNENRAKALENIIYENLKAAQDAGKLGEDRRSGSESFKVKEGHAAIHRKAVGTFTTGNLTDGASGAAFASRDTRNQVITNPSPSVRVRNLLNTSVMTSSYLEYPQFVGGEGAPGYQVNQGDVKPQLDYDFIMVPVRPKILAAWTRVSKQALNDISWLSNFFSSQMMLDLLKKEDAELLNGTGTNSIKGIIPSAADYTPTDAGYNTLFEYMADGVAQLESKDYNPNGFVLHPLDYVRLLIYKTTTGEFNYPGLVFGGSNRDILTFNGVPIYKMNQIAVGKALLGDWTRAELLIREGINFGVFYEDQDNVTRNLVTLRIEEELALAVYHPQAFLDMNIVPVTSGV